MGNLGNFFIATVSKSTAGEEGNNRAQSNHRAHIYILYPFAPAAALAFPSEKCRVCC